MLKKVARIAGLLGLLPMLACATGGGLPDEPVMKPYEPVEWVANLGSGLRVIVKEDRSAPQVTIATVFGAGASSDPKGLEGIAHLVEHLAFRSRPGGGPQYWDVLNRIGADKNAWTSHDLTGYYTIAHKSNLHQMMQLEAWRLVRTLDGVTPEVFTTEREVVRNELRQRWETTINNRMFDLIFEQLYPVGHPLRRPVGGTHDSLSAIKLSDIQAFVKEQYRPENCTIVIAGDFETDEVRKMLGMWPAEALFGPGGPSGPAVEPRARLNARTAPPVPATAQSQELKRHKGPIAEPTLVLAWSLPPGYRDTDELAAFAGVRLNFAIGALEVEEDDDILGASAGPFNSADSSAMMMFAELKPGADPERARKRLVDILVNAWTTEYSRIMTEGVRWNTATSLLFDSSDSSSAAQTLASYVATTGNTKYFNDTLERLARIKDNDITDFAHKWLNRDRVAAVFFEPESTDIPRLVGGAAGGPAAPGASAASTNSEHRIGEATAAQDMDLGPEQIRKTIVTPGLAAIPRFRLSNGLDVYVVQRQGAPVAAGMLRLRGGNASTQPPGAASLSISLSRAQCREYPDLMPVGGSIGRSTGLANTTTSVTILSGNLSNGLAALADNVRCREASDEAFLHLPRSLEKQARSFELSEKRPEFVAGKRFYAALYPNHPFSQVSYNNPKTLMNLKREDAQAFVQSHFRPDNGALALYGDVTLEEAKKEAETYLVKWTGGGGATMDPPPPPAGPSARKVFLVDRPKATQASVRVGCRLAEVKPEWVPALDVLEGVATERAWKLREEWGATYGVHPGVARLPGNAADLTFSGAIENAQAGKSVTRLLAIIAELGSGNMDNGLFVMKRWDAGLEFMNRFASADSKASAILDAVMRRWPLDVWDKYPENLAATTPGTLKEILAPCVGKEVIAVVGDAGVLRPQLEKEGLTLDLE
ncbi:MAG TPA: insulinase family protein, partial [Polyangia bacterium]